jgi:glycogen debranching enzyme
MSIRVFVIAAFVTLAALASAEDGKFPLPDSLIQLEGEPSSLRYFDVVGRKAILMGMESGAMEAWIWPFKIARDIALEFRREDFAAPLSSERLGRWIIVRPESTTIRFAGDDFSVAATYFVPLNEPAVVILLDVDCTKPLTISLNFTPELRPAWPASLGGQSSFWSDEDKAFIISESRRRYNALLGSPDASAHFSTPAHRLSETPNRFDIEVTPQTAREGFVPVVICGGSLTRDDAKSLYKRILTNLPALYAERLEHANALRKSLLSIESPDPALDLAFEWGKVSLDDGNSCNPDLGCGLVAGYGLSGRSERPGFAWFFGGDTFYNQFAITGYGDFATVRSGLEMIRRNQRADGKIMHELSQGAGMIPWFEEYPYGYYHMETSPYYIIAVMNYVTASGDVEFLRESWESLVKAFRYAVTIVDESDGLLDGRKGGLGALEVGVLLKDLKTDIYVAGLWVESLRSLRRAAEITGDGEVIAQIDPLLEKAAATLRDRYFIPGQGYHALALAVDGTAVSELTIWPSTPMMFGLLPERDALSTLNMLARPEIATDYGMRMLTNRSEKYEPAAYNNGSVWGVITGYTAMAQYRYNRPLAGWQLVQALSRLTFEDSRGDIAEVYSGDFHRPLDEAVPHQLFATGGFIAPVTRGLLGLQPDAVNKILTFSPQLPSEWERLRINNAPLGSGKLDISMEESLPSITYEFQSTGIEGWKIDFRPVYPVGTKITGMSVDGKPVEYRLETKRSAVIIDAQFDLTAATSVEVKIEGLQAVAFPPPESKPGERSSGLRYIDSWLDAQDGTIYYEAAGRSGREYRVFHKYYSIGDGRTPERHELRARTVEIPIGGKEWQRVLIALHGGELEVIERPDGR